MSFIRTLTRGLVRDLTRTAVRRYLDGQPRNPSPVPRPLPGRHLLYKLYDSSGTLLYVGISSRGPIRLQEHYLDKPWFQQVFRAEFSWHDTRELVERAEKWSIETEDPRYNKIYNDRPW